MDHRQGKVAGFGGEGLGRYGSEWHPMQRARQEAGALGGRCAESVTYRGDNGERTRIYRVGRWTVMGTQSRWHSMLSHIVVMVLECGSTGSFLEPNGAKIRQTT